jgi:hypothetical protein
LSGNIYTFAQQKGIKLRSLVSVVSVVFVCCAVTSKAYGLPGESIVLDPNTGDYQITYFGTDGSGKRDNKVQRHAIYVPSTKIQPDVGSAFKLKEAEVVYSYRLKNASASQQSLASFAVTPVSDIVSALQLTKRGQGMDLEAAEKSDEIGSAALTTPPRWTGIVWNTDTEGLKIVWRFYIPNDGLIAGSSQDGFGFSSKDIPGIGVGQFQGRTSAFAFVDGGPTGEIKDRLRDLRRINFVPRFVAVPAIAVPVPFNAAVLLGRIRSHVGSWPGKKLLDPAFAARLDRYMAAATDAYRRNQPKTGKENIGSLRKLLEREHKNLDRDEEDNADTAEHKTSPRLNIDLLAARVLDFDLRYVLKRME